MENERVVQKIGPLLLRFLQTLSEFSLNACWSSRGSLRGHDRRLGRGRCGDRGLGRGFCRARGVLLACKKNLSPQYHRVPTTTTYGESVVIKQDLYSPVFD
jgi:hypothetical protein